MQAARYADRFASRKTYSTAVSSRKGLRLSYMVPERMTLIPISENIEKRRRMFMNTGNPKKDAFARQAVVLYVMVSRRKHCGVLAPPCAARLSRLTSGEAIDTADIFMANKTLRAQKQSSDGIHAACIAINDCGRRDLL
jgi:hypothetical protein